MSTYREEYGVTKGKIEPVVIEGIKLQTFENPDPYVMRVGGMDLAKRHDHSAFIVLRLERVKDELYFWIEAQMEWPHVNYKTIANDCLKIYRNFPMDKIGFDRSGVGDAASELFDKTTLPMEEVVSTMQRKMDIISIIKGLLENKKLKLDPQTARKIMDQMLAQERIISDAGNELYKHPANAHDDLFWALGYACYVGLPYIVGYAEPVITTGRPELTEPEKIIEHHMGGDVDSIFPI